MRASDITRGLSALIPTRRPVYLWGPPGVGKSSVIKQAAESLDLPVIDIRAVLLDPVDLRGLPTVKDGYARWCSPDFLPKGGRGVLFFDEMAQAPPLVQAGLLQLTLDRKIGDYVLPEEWSVVAASNRQEDRAGAHRLISPLLNRFIHLDMEVSNEDWHAWAVKSGLASEVRSFIHYRPGLLFDFDPAQNKRAFPTPRSWSFVSDVIGHLPEDLMHPIVSGAVGEGPAAEFVGFVKIYRDLPDPEKILAAPTTHPVPKEPAVLYALSGALVEKVRKGDTALLGKFISYVTRMPAEFSVLCFKDAAEINRGIFRAPGGSDWLAKFKHLFNQPK